MDGAVVIEPSAAPAIAHAALARVCDAAWAASLRDDTPLPGPADAIAIAAAVQEAAAERGLVVVLHDSDLAQARTVADLVRAVATQLEDGA